MSSTSRVRQALGTALLGAVLGFSASCGDVARTGRAPTFLIIDQLGGDAGGDDEDNFSSVVMSDVETLVEVTEGGQTFKVPTRFNDSGKVTLRLGLKNAGTPASPTQPSSLNEITMTRYRVEFRRTDGRNTPGVDVPYGFEGGMTVTVPASGTAEGVFDLVRHTSKTEPPLRNLAGAGAGRFINTVAEVSFFGRDQVGHDVTVNGVLTVNFADFGDKK